MKPRTKAPKMSSWPGLSPAIWPPMPVRDFCNTPFQNVQCIVTRVYCWPIKKPCKAPFLPCRPACNFYCRCSETNSASLRSMFIGQLWRVFTTGMGKNWIFRSSGPVTSPDILVMRWLSCYSKQPSRSLSTILSCGWWATQVCAVMKSLVGNWFIFGAVRYILCLIPTINGTVTPDLTDTYPCLPQRGQFQAEILPIVYIGNSLFETANIPIISSYNYTNSKGKRYWKARPIVIRNTT